MKYTRQQIKDVSLSAASHADALATLYQMIMQEISASKKISRRKIRAAVDMTCTEHEIALWDQDEYALAESVFAAAGWTIVDDEPEPVQDWQPIDTAPLNAEWIVVFNKYGSWYKAQKDSYGAFVTPTGLVVDEPIHWMPIPPLPENDK